MIEDVEFDTYDEFCADVGDDDGDVVGKGPIDGGSVDGGFLKNLLCHTKAELLVGTAKEVSKL
jgi:hypothetical protein